MIRRTGIGILLFIVFFSGCGQQDELKPSSQADAFLQLAFVRMDVPNAKQPIGCGDELVVVPSSRISSGTAERDVQSALEELFSVSAFWDPETLRSVDTWPEDPDGSGLLYNGLQHSQDLSVDAVSVNGSALEVRLSGSLISAGTCDDPRIKAQLLETLRSNSGASELRMTINGETLDEWFDLRG